MAALALVVCTSLQEICIVVHAFVNKGYSIRQSLVYLHKQQRISSFHSYCRELWRTEIANRQQQVLNSECSANIKQLLVNMDRAGIDFAAREALPISLDAKSSCAGTDATQRFMETERLECNETAKSAFNYNDIEIITGDEVDTTFYEYIDTLPVYHNEDVRPLEEGVSYTITGHILMNCERFSINFIIDNATRDIALHINPRLPQSYIVRNTKANNTWGNEEVNCPQPFSLHRGNRFSIQVLVTDACYMISVNGHHFAEYAHRLPYGLVSTVEVRGDVEHIDMQRSVVEEYPARMEQVTLRKIRVKPKEGSEKAKANREICICSSNESSDQTDNGSLCMPQSWRLIPSPSVRSAQRSASTRDEAGLSLPYYGILPVKSLCAGRCLIIEGRVKLLPHSFYINLQSGQHIWPHPVIAFHFNPRFSKQTTGAIGKAVVCRNAWHNGRWDAEERSELDTNLLPGKTFYMAILCTDVAFEVYVNSKLITSFNYRVYPDVVDTVYIQGDIKLWDVVLQHHFPKQVEDACELAVYRNPAYVNSNNEELI